MMVVAHNFILYLVHYALFLGAINIRILYLVAYFCSLFRKDGLGHAYIRLGEKVAELLQAESRFGVSRCQ